MFRKKEEDKLDCSKCLEEQKMLIENFIMTINQIQDVEALIFMTEEEKNERRNSIINYKRKKYVDKIIKLDEFAKNSI